MPSVFTLIPIIGTSLIIIYTNKNNYLYNFLSNRVLIFIGLISYSLYLWHQPLLAFFRIYNLYTLNNSQIFILICVSFILAYLSWRFVEKPFRNLKKNLVKIKYLFFSLLFIFTLFIFLLLRNKKRWI